MVLPFDMLKVPLLFPSQLPTLSELTRGQLGHLLKDVAVVGGRAALEMQLLAQRQCTGMTATVGDHL